MRIRRWPGVDRGSGHDLHHVADVQGVVESLGRLPGQVYAAVGPDPHAVLVEGVTTGKEYRIRHRCVIEQTAAVMEVFPEDVEGARGGRGAGFAGRYRNRTVADRAIAHQPRLLGGQV